MSGQLAGEGRSGAGELERARAVDDLLRRAYHGPPGDPAADAADTAGEKTVTASGAESWRQALAEDGWSRQLTTLEGWRKFTAAESRPPELPDARRWAAMPEPDQDLFDEYRLDYHTRLAAAATSTLRRVVTTGRRLTLLNRHATSARRGMILSGAAGTGKTTAITQFGKTHEGCRPGDHEQCSSAGAAWCGSIGS